jgi:hypothetical protein
MLYANNTLVSSKFNATSPALQQSVANYFQVLNAAGQGDMGMWAPGNLLLSQTTLNATVSANEPVSALFAASPYLGWSGGFATVMNMSAASYLRATGLKDDASGWGLPVPQNRTTPAVFALSYLCVGRKLKPTSNLIICTFSSGLCASSTDDGSCLCRRRVHVQCLLVVIDDWGGCVCAVARQRRCV